MSITMMLIMKSMIRTTMTAYEVQFMMTIMMSALLTRYMYRMGKMHVVDDYDNTDVFNDNDDANNYVDNDDDCLPST